MGEGAIAPRRGRWKAGGGHHSNVRHPAKRTAQPAQGGSTNVKDSSISTPCANGCTPVRPPACPYRTPRYATPRYATPRHAVQEFILHVHVILFIRKESATGEVKKTELRPTSTKKAFRSSSVNQWNAYPSSLPTCRRFLQQ